MSFTRVVKEEIVKLDSTEAENVASLSAFFRNSAKFENNKINLITESNDIMLWIINNLKKIYNIEVLVEKLDVGSINKSEIYMISILEKVSTILEDLSVLNGEGVFEKFPKNYIIEDLEEEKAYIRGAFLSKGSINDPKTAQYHLEFLFDNKFESVLVQRLLNDFDLDSKILLRDKKYMVYIKDSEKISDFLRILGASNAVMYYENIRVFKEQKNITNRLNNCEQANTDKIIQTATNQINQINYISDIMGLELLDEKLQEAASYRLKYPDASLLELSEIISLETSKKITKSGLNHRFRKIKEIYENLKRNAK